MLYFERINYVSKKLMLINQVHRKSVIFVTVGISQIIFLSFNQMYVIYAKIY